MATLSFPTGGTFEEQKAFFEANQELFKQGSDYGGLTQTLKFINDPTTSADDLPRFQADFSKLMGYAQNSFQNSLATTTTNLQNDLLNLSNITDFSGLDATKTAEYQTAFQNPESEAQKLLANVQQHIGTLQSYGQDTSSYESTLSGLQNLLSGTNVSGTNIGSVDGITRTENGFQLNSEIPTQGAVGRTGENLRYDSATGNIIGATTGTVYKTGIMDPTEANRLMTELNAGFAEPAKVPVTATPSTIDNVIDARDFVEAGQNIEVGGVPTLQGGIKSPLFFDPANPSALYYIPPGSTSPIRISNPDELQALAQQGLIEVNGTRLPTDQASSWLQGQQVPAPAGTTPSAGTSPIPGGAMSPLQPIGAVSTLAAQTLAALQPFADQIQKLQTDYIGFKPTDLSAFRTGLEKASGLDAILNELVNVDTSLAEIIGIQRRVPETTLARAQGTEIAQSTLDRQRTIELQKLSAAAAPLVDLKNVLQQDLERRMELIDEAVDIQREADGFKLEQLGRALDFAVSNQSLAAQQAEFMFNAAVSDYESNLAQQAAAAQLEQDRIEYENKLMTDFYEATGYAVNPLTGEISPTLAMLKHLSAGSGGSGGGGGSSGGSMYDLSSTEMGALASLIEGDAILNQFGQATRDALIPVLSDMSDQVNVYGPSNPDSLGEGDPIAVVAKRAQALLDYNIQQKEYITGSSSNDNVFDPATMANVLGTVDLSQVEN